jgi:anti-sigma28 factor (negative regulator of flagellin synthesis)
MIKNICNHIIKNISVWLMICVCIVLSACGKSEEIQPIATPVSEESDSSTENEPQDKEEHIDIPSKEEVLSMRELVLEGMNEDEIERLTENIKTANLTMESAYLNDRIFNKLADPESVYWQYFDKAGDFQLGWWYKGQIVDKEVIMKLEGISEAEFTEREYEPGIVYNRFDADNFIEILEDMQSSVKNEMLRADMQQLIDLTYMAAVTHEMEYANQIYKILHDLDYFLLRYGIDDVGKYTQDTSTVSKYYGVLTIYGATPFTLLEK